MTAMRISIVPPIGTIIIAITPGIEPETDERIIPGIDGIAPIIRAVIVIVIDDYGFLLMQGVGGGDGIERVGDGGIPRGDGPIIRIGIDGAFGIPGGIELGIATCERKGGS